MTRTADKLKIKHDMLQSIVMKNNTTQSTTFLNSLLKLYSSLNQCDIKQEIISRTTPQIIEEQESLALQKLTSSSPNRNSINS
eukprot:Pgem_evm1s11887